MSRTIKDKPLNLLVKEDLSKKRRSFMPWGYLYVRNEPGWWKLMMTTKRKRTQFKGFKHKVLKTAKEDLDLLDILNIWCKPHVYYW